MSCYLDFLVFRTTDHKKLDLAYKFFKKPIINALSDLSHPCQAISDFYTLKEYFGTMDNLNIVWMGDMNNVLFSLLEVIFFTKNTKVDIFTHDSIYSKKKGNFNLNPLFSIIASLKIHNFLANKSSSSFTLTLSLALPSTFDGIQL